MKKQNNGIDPKVLEKFLSSRLIETIYPREDFDKFIRKLVILDVIMIFVILILIMYAYGKFILPLWFFI